jgi:aminoglycoside phosphotransferase (APT) family kinase protein
VTDRHERLPAVRYFDWSRRYLPQPYCIYDWVEGEPLWNTPDSQLYFLAGQALARIHQVRFSAFYVDFLSIGAEPVGWNERYRSAFAKEVGAARPRLRRDAIHRLETVSIPSAAPGAPTLVHNDFAPGNILVKDGRLTAIIDWDNAVIEAPHLDFVKMKYWTARSTAGELAHTPDLFSAFVDGYGPEGRAIVSSPLFALYEILWLLRVLNFERSKEEQGLARAPGYPAAGVYEKFLDTALSEMK